MFQINAFVVCINAFVVCVNAFVVCVNAFVVCINAFVVCVNAFIVCVNTFVVCINIPHNSTINAAQQSYEQSLHGQGRINGPHSFERDYKC